jgi:hypothetical protein
MPYRNPIFNFADKHPVVAFFAVPVAMTVIGKAIAMSIRTVKYDSPLSAIMPNQDNGNQLTVLGYTGGGTADSDMIQARPVGAPVRYDDMYRDTIMLPNPNYKARVPTPMPTQIHKASMEVGGSPTKRGDQITLAGSNHSVFAGLSGVHKLNY